MAIQIKNPITVMGAENLDTVLTEQDTALNNLETEINNLSPNTPSNALVKPTTAPTSQSIVSIDTNNEQQNLTLGDGLSISNNVLSASGGGKLYEHILYFDYGSAMAKIITNNSNVFTVDTLKQFLIDNGFSGLTASTKLYPIYDTNEVSGSGFINYFGIRYITTDQYPSIVFNKISTTLQNDSIKWSNGRGSQNITSFSDSVREL